MYFHIDLDCFFVSCERLKYPFLKNKSVAVINAGDNTIFSQKKIGSLQHNQEVSSFMPNLVYDKFNSHNKLYTDTNHFAIAKGCSCSFCQTTKERFYDAKEGRFKGIIVAKSYEAKAFGIKTATKLQEAFYLCPSLIVLPQDYLFYYQKSNDLKSYLHTKIPHLEQYSIDEFFGDLNGWVEQKDVEAFLQNLQTEILQKFDLPVSIGASSGKWIAKLATNYAKPYGIKIVPKEKIENFTKDIPVQDFPGIGKAYAKKLLQRGVYTLAQTQRVKGLFESWGKHGKELYERIQGSNKEFVKRSNSRQSIGISRVFPTVYSEKEVLFRASILATHLCYTIHNMNLTPTAFFFKIKDSREGSSKKSMRIYKDFSEHFYKKLCKEAVKELLSKNPQVYSISLSVSNFTQNRPKTLSLLDIENETKIKKIENSFKAIRNKYGLSSIGYALC